MADGNSPPVDRRRHLKGVGFDYGRIPRGLTAPPRATSTRFPTDETHPRAPADRVRRLALPGLDPSRKLGDDIHSHTPCRFN